MRVLFTTDDLKPRRRRGSADTYFSRCQDYDLPTLRIERFICALPWGEGSVLDHLRRLPPTSGQLMRFRSHPNVVAVDHV